jgi:excisionase family DNA binding protein
MASKKKVERATAGEVDMNDLITMPEAATLRGVTTAAITELVRRGRLRAVEMFGRRLVSRSEVESFEPERKGWPKGKARKATKQPAQRRGRKAA